MTSSSRSICRPTGTARPCTTVAGGYNGVMPQTLGVENFGDPRKPTPLANGFISFASDSGHQAADSNDASFAVNDEALNNFGALHIKKTRDVAAALAELCYGSPIKRMYFIGGSIGGREALTAAMRWPEAYDGVVAYYPTANFMGLRLWGAALPSAVYPNESAGWIPPALVNKIAADALEACDTLDGAKDGIVSNMVKQTVTANFRFRDRPDEGLFIFQGPGSPTINRTRTRPAQGVAMQ
jgi:pimeloyl-ACP methyl ester carboxylesterase